MTTAFARTVRVLRGAECRFALFGAVGLAAHGLPRATSDVDVLALPDVLDRGLWSGVKGLKVDVRHGDDVDNLLGCVKIGPTSHQPVDVVVPRGRWPLRALDRVRMSVNVHGVDVPLLALEDLALAKVHEVVNADDDVVDFILGEKGGCATAPARVSVPLTLLGALLVMRRAVRRRQTIGVSL